MKIRTSVAVTAVTLSLVATGCSAPAAQTDQDSLYGAWIMTSLEAATDGTFESIPYSGQIVFTESGRMSTQAQILVPDVPDTDYTITDDVLVITPEDASEGWRVTYERARPSA